jgi:peptidoglycan/LPS O-acetylase OafA/YrhL
MKSRANFRTDIQVLRGLAVLAVVLFHATEEFFPLGYLGVDVFFVISGFVMTPLIIRIFVGTEFKQTRATNLVKFYKRRFYRLAPALGVSLMISSIAIFLFASPDIHERFSFQGIATLLLLGNLGAYRYSGDYFSSNPNPLVHTWSLSVEEQIYIFIPLALFLILQNRVSVKKTVVIFYILISVISFSSFLYPSMLQPLYSFFGIQLGPQISFYSPIDRIWQFGLGGICHFILERWSFSIRKPSIFRNTTLVLPLLIILFGAINVGPRIGSVLASATALTLIAFRALEGIPSFISTMLAWLGDRSYSIYLVHMPLLYVAKFSPLMTLESSESRTFEIIIAIAVSIFLGALIFSRIENRFRENFSNPIYGVRRILPIILISYVLPLGTFLAISLGSNNQYWGLDKNAQQPPYAGDLDINCERDSLAGPPCIYENEDSLNTVLLIGDSHAGQISQALLEAASSERWNLVVLVHSGCPVIFRGDQIPNQCQINNKRMKAWVYKNRPDAIIVSQRVHADSPLREMQDALATLHSIVPNILLIENIPVFPDATEFMVSRPLIMEPYRPPKEFNQSNMEKEGKRASDQLGIWARNNQISTLNFEKIFCNNFVCKRFSQGRWLYRDDNHLSVEGAKLFTPQLRIYLKSI